MIVDAFQSLDQPLDIDELEERLRVLADSSREDRAPDDRPRECWQQEDRPQPGRQQEDWPLEDRPQEGPERDAWHTLLDLYLPQL